MKQSSYARIGAFALAALALAAAAATLMGGKGRSRPEALFETYIEETVQGISEGSAVKYRGIPIGTVKSVSFAMSKYGPGPGADGDPAARRAHRYTRVVFGIDITEFPDPDDFPEMIAAQVQDGLRAHTKSQGITGLSYLDLDFEDAPRDLPVPWTPEYQYIPTAPSFVKTLTDVMQSLSQEIGSLSHITDAVTNLAARTSLLADTANGAIVSMQEGLAGVPDALAAATNAIADADAILRSLKPASDEFPGLVAEAKALLAEARETMAKLSPGANAALESAAAAADSAGDAVASVAGPAQEAAESLARAAEEIARLAAELREDPSRLLRGNNERDVLQ